MNVTRIGLDIAKQVFQVHGVEEHGKVVIQKTLRRDPVINFFGQMPSRAWAMSRCLTADGSLPPGSGGCPDNTPAEARFVSGLSPNGAIPTCATC